VNNLATIAPRDLFARPELIRPALAVAADLAAVAAKLQRWPEMEQAVDVLIERQQAIIDWWAFQVRGGGRPSETISRAMTVSEAERIIGLNRTQVSKIRNSLAHTDYRERLIEQTRKAAVPARRADPGANRPTPARHGPDFWPTPDSLIAACVNHILPMLPPTAAIWECACGDGRLAQAIRAGGRGVFHSDLYPTPGSLDMPRDFLISAPPPDPSLIVVTNPPFNRTDDFLQRGLELMELRLTGGLVLLLRHDHLTAASRAEALNRATLEVHCCWRPRWIADTEGSPRWSFVWVAWLPTVMRVGPRYVVEPTSRG
jgi:hypothetical protein